MALFRQVASRKWIFGGLTALGVLLVIDLLSYALLVASGEDLRELRKTRANLIGSHSPQEEQATVVVGQDLNPKVLHPYVGYVYDTLANDHQGMLGADPAEGDETTYNVAITGGSVAANFCLAMADDLSTRLASAPAVAKRSIRVSCLAVGGWHQPQQAMALAYAVSLGASIDLVINIDGFNETVVAARQSPAHSVLYPRYWPSLTGSLLSPAGRDALGKVTAIDYMRRSLATLFSSAPFSWSYAALAAWNAGDSTLRAVRVNAQAEFENRKKITAPFQIGYGASIHDDEVLDRVADLWADSSQMMDAIQRGRGKKYIHVLQPHQYVPDGKRLSETELRIAYDPSVPYTKLAVSGYTALGERFDQLRGSGVDFLDASKIFAENEEDLYIDVCCHFNHRGNEILLVELLEFLEARGSLE